MEKEVFEFQANDMIHDAVLSLSSVVVKKDGKPVYTDKDRAIGKVRGAVNQITVYLKEGVNSNVVNKVLINSSTILMLADKIREHQAKEWEEDLSDY